MDEFLSRVVHNLADRVGGPMSFRLICQPLMATAFAVRAGLRDARVGRPPYLWSAIADASERHNLVRDGWRDVARLFVLAVALDALYQYRELHWFYPGEALTVAAALAIVPYALLRGPVTRIARRRPR
jgi:hypothetical protein